jgi:hypothetical protein
MASPLKFFQGHVIAVTAGYIGDRPPYQGHVAILDGNSGKLLQVWNSLCSNRTGLLEPDSCPQTQSAIWGRAGAVIDPGNGRHLHRHRQWRLERHDRLGRFAHRDQCRVPRKCWATTPRPIPRN